MAGAQHLRLIIHLEGDKTDAARRRDIQAPARPKPSTEPTMPDEELDGSDASRNERLRRETAALGKVVTRAGGGMSAQHGNPETC